MFHLILLLAVAQTPETAPTFGTLIITASNDYAAYQDALAKSGSADAEVTAATNRAASARAALEAKAAKLKVTMDMLNNLSPAKPSLPTVTKPLTVPKPELPPAPQATTDVAPAPPIPKVETPPAPDPLPETADDESPKKKFASNHIIVATIPDCTACREQQKILDAWTGWKVDYFEMQAPGNLVLHEDGKTYPISLFPQVFFVGTDGKTVHRVKDTGRRTTAELKAEMGFK